jgi:hypothetical protein
MTEKMGLKVLFDVFVWESKGQAWSFLFDSKNWKMPKQDGFLELVSAVMCLMAATHDRKNAMPCCWILALCFAGFGSLVFEQKNDLGQE